MALPRNRRAASRVSPGPPFAVNRSRKSWLVSPRILPASSLYARLRETPGLQREAPFLLPLEGNLIVGTIDLLLGDGCIIDYKTGHFHPERNARYEWQILLYAAAVRRLLGQQPREGILYYVDEKKAHTITISDAEMDAALRDAAIAITRMQEGALEKEA